MMINYSIQVILFQVLFLLVYDLFLAKETFFTKNRWYLIGTAMVSFVLPLLKVPTLQKAVSQESSFLLPAVVLSPQSVIEKSLWGWSVNYVNILFWMGFVLFFIIFAVKLFVVVKLVFTGEVRKKNNYTLVLLSDSLKAFSFFNYIFLGKEISKEKQYKIIQHELVHYHQRHSLDLLFFEFLKIIMWFNPMLYWYQKRITLVHEFISDDIVSKSTEKNSYINNLLSDVFQVAYIPFINQFYKKSLIKKRIMMMTKNKSKKTNQLKYLLLIPVLASMILYSSCITKTADKDAEKSEIQQLKKGVNKADFSTKEGEVLPFSVLDKVPTFKGCAEGDKNCLNKGIRRFVSENFDVNLANSLGLSTGKKQIYVQFKIDKTGQIIDVKARAPHPKLKEEAIRIVKALPKFKAGEFQGKQVITSYTLPITFNVQ